MHLPRQENRARSSSHTGVRRHRARARPIPLPPIQAVKSTYIRQRGCPPPDSMRLSRSWHPWYLPYAGCCWNSSLQRAKIIIKPRSCIQRSIKNRDLRNIATIFSKISKDLQQSAEKCILLHTQSCNRTICARTVVLHAQVACRLCARNDKLGKIRPLFPRILVKSRYRHEEVSSLLEIMRRGAALRDFWFR